MYHVMKFQSPFERLKQYNISSEVMLFKAILTQAIIDATNTSNDPEARKYEIEAKSWIFGDTEYFNMVCDIVNISPCYVRKITKEAMHLQKHKIQKRREEDTQKFRRPDRSNTIKVKNTG